VDWLAIAVSGREGGGNRLTDLRVCGSEIQKGEFEKKEEEEEDRRYSRR